MRVFRLIAVFFIAALLAAGCAGKIKTIKLTNADPEHIWLQYFVDQNDNPVPQGYQHPAQLTPDQFKKILEAVAFEEYSFFAWRKVGRVFADPEVKRLQESLAQALGQATADQWAHFAIIAMRRELLSITATPHLTDGVCYIKDGKFNLVIGNVDFELIEPDRELWRRDPRDRFGFDSIRLRVDPEHGIDIPPIVEGDKWFKKRRVNWLVFDLAKFLTPPVEEQATPEPGSVAERLRELKQLLDQGLITPEEYEQKRKQILEGL